MPLLEIELRLLGRPAGT